MGAHHAGRRTTPEDLAVTILISSRVGTRGAPSSSIRPARPTETPETTEVSGVSFLDVGFLEGRFLGRRSPGRGSGSRHRAGHRFGNRSRTDLARRLSRGDARRSRRRHRGRRGKRRVRAARLQDDQAGQFGDRATSPRLPPLSTPEAIAFIVPAVWEMVACSCWRCSPRGLTSDQFPRAALEAAPANMKELG